MKHIRCEDVIVQLVVREYDDMNRPISERTSQPIKVLRNAQTLDFWGQVDKAVASMQQPAASEPPPAPKPKGKK